jgi:hypothetical protein
VTLAYVVTFRVFSFLQHTETPAAPAQACFFGRGSTGIAHVSGRYIPALHPAPYPRSVSALRVGAPCRRSVSAHALFSYGVPIRRSKRAARLPVCPAVSEVGSDRAPFHVEVPFPADHLMGHAWYWGRLRRRRRTHTHCEMEGGRTIRPFAFALSIHTQVLYIICISIYIDLSSMCSRPSCVYGIYVPMYLPAHVVNLLFDC